MSKLSLADFKKLKDHIEKYPEFYSLLFDKNFMIATKYEKDTHKEYENNISAFTFNPLWDIEGAARKALIAIRMELQKLQINNAIAYNALMTAAGDSFAHALSQVPTSRVRLNIPTFSKNPPLLTLLGIIGEKEEIASPYSPLATCLLSNLSDLDTLASAYQQKIEIPKKLIPWATLPLNPDGGGLTLQLSGLRARVDQLLTNKDSTDEQLWDCLHEYIQKVSGLHATYRSLPEQEKMIYKTLHTEIMRLMIAIYGRNNEPQFPAILDLATRDLAVRERFEKYFSKHSKLEYLDDTHYKFDMAPNFSGTVKVAFKLTVAGATFKSATLDVGINDNNVAASMRGKHSISSTLAAAELLAAHTTFKILNKSPKVEFISISNAVSKYSTAFTPPRDYKESGIDFSLSMTDDNGKSVSTTVKDFRFQPFSEIPKVGLIKKNLNPATVAANGKPLYTFNIHRLLGLGKSVRIQVGASSDEILLESNGDGNYSIVHNPDGAKVYNFDPATKTRFIKTALICTIQPAPGSNDKPTTIALQIPFDDLHSTPLKPTLLFMLPTDDICEAALQSKQQDGWKVTEVSIVQEKLVSETLVPKKLVAADLEFDIAQTAKAAKLTNTHVRDKLLGNTHSEVGIIELKKRFQEYEKKYNDLLVSIRPSSKDNTLSAQRLLDLALCKEHMVVIRESLKVLGAPSSSDVPVPPRPSSTKPKP